MNQDLIDAFKLLMSVPVKNFGGQHGESTIKGLMLTACEVIAEHTKCSPELLQAVEELQNLKSDKLFTLLYTFASKSKYVVLKDKADTNIN